MKKEDALYAIIWWITDDYVTFVVNEDGSIMTFQDLDTADDYANGAESEECPMRVVSLEGIEEGNPPYAIIWFSRINSANDEITFVHDDDGSVMTFEKIRNADTYANGHWASNDLRVVSLAGVED